MFDALLGKKFTVKCKHAIKSINERLKPIRNRKQAVVNILKKDVSELLRNGGDSHALARMDDLIVEINRLACYDMIDNFCGRILKQLPLLQKQSECPPEDMEFVATLIFAAARFSDLPELCNLRSTFLARYGNPLEGFVNPEFKEKTASKSFPQAKKLQLMEDIACEFNVLWNPKSFDHMNPSASGRNRRVKENPPKAEAIRDIRVVNRDDEPVKKTMNKARAEPENVSPPPKEEDWRTEKKKVDAHRRMAQPFKAREEIVEKPKPAVDLGPQVVNRRSMKAQAQARVSSIGEETDRDGPVAPESSKADLRTVVNPRSTKANIIEEVAVDLGPQATKQRSRRAQASANAPAEVLRVREEEGGAAKERTLRSIPPPYVKSIGPKTEPPENAAVLAAERKEVKDAEEQGQVNDERTKPRSVRRKPSHAEQSHRRRRTAGEEGVDFDLDEPEDVDQLLIYYSKRRTTEDWPGSKRAARDLHAERRQERKGKQGENGGEHDPPAARGEVDELAARFARFKGGSG